VSHKKEQSAVAKMNAAIHEAVSHQNHAMVKDGLKTTVAPGGGQVGVSGGIGMIAGQPATAG